MALGPNIIAIAAGEGGNSLAYTTDGTNWIGLGDSIFTSCKSICYLPVVESVSSSESSSSSSGSASHQTGIFVAVGSGPNSLAYSHNGVNWTGLGTTIFTHGHKVIHTGEFFLAVGDGSYKHAKSYDGITWEGFNPAYPSTWSAQWNGQPIPYDVMTDGTNFISVGDSTVNYQATAIAYSADSVSWGPVTDGSFPAIIYAI